MMVKNQRMELMGCVNLPNMYHSIILYSHIVIKYFLKIKLN